MAGYADSLNALNAQLQVGHQMSMDNKRHHLQLAMMARSIGDSELFAEEMNKASGKGLIARMLGKKMYSADDMKTVARPKGTEDLTLMSKGGEGTIGEEEAAGGEFSSLGKKMLSQAKAKQDVNPEFTKIAAAAALEKRGDELQRILAQEGVGAGVGLWKELDSGYGPKARQAMARLDAVQTNEDEYNALKRKALAKQALIAKKKEWDEIPTEAEEQYDYHYQKYQKALAGGKQGEIAKAYNNMVNQFKLLDNKFQWNMSRGLSALRPPKGGGGFGGKNEVLWSTPDETVIYLPKGVSPYDLEENDKRLKGYGKRPGTWRPVDPEDNAKRQDQILAYRKALAETQKGSDEARRIEKKIAQLEGRPQTSMTRVVYANPIRGQFGFASDLAYQDTDQGLASPAWNTPATASNDPYEVGKVYKDAQGRKARYLGNGKWTTPRL